MRYDLKSLPLAELIQPVSLATAHLVRLDERIQRSPIGAGFAERLHFADACASLYLDGELVHLEDLVLHDAEADIRAPTHELTIAHAVLRSRRRIAAHPPGWALSPDGLRALKAPESGERRLVEPEAGTPAVVEPHSEEDDPLARELAAMDAVLARSEAALAGVLPDRLTDRPARDPLLYEPEWDEDARLAEWARIAEETEDLPAVLRMVLLIDAWNEINVLQHAPWLGRLVAAASLRQAGMTTGAHLLAINSGLRQIRRDDRLHPRRFNRIVALLKAIALAAEAGLKDFDRLSLARQSMERKLEGRRTSSHLPELVELVFRRPLLSATMISESLGVSHRAAIRLVEELGLREMTGRGRFRAWGVL